MFTPSREAKIILVLSAPDAESHLEILQNINQIFSDSKNTEKLYNCTNSQEILNELNAILHQL